MMWPRHERWYRSMGVCCPGPGNHWEEHNGIRRGVVSEGQMHFDSEEAAIAWTEVQEWMPYVYTSDGVVVDRGKNLPRNQLDVDVWQIMINGEKPANLAGANDERFVVTGRESRRPR